MLLTNTGFFRSSRRAVAGTLQAASVAILATLGVATAAHAQLATVSARMNEQVVMVESTTTRADLQTTIFKPDGAGPFPVLVMNHGKDAGDPHSQKRDRFLHLSREFVKRGYAVVLPMRKGFAGSTGNYADYGCNMSSNGQLQADDLQGTIDFLQTQPWADSQHIVVAGQSYGGLATLALGTRKIPGVRGLINFAGGLRADGGDCRWQSALVQAFNDYGIKSVSPSLWFYGANDSYFNHELANRLYSAYTGSGGNAKLVAYGRFKSDAHGMAGSRDGVKIWWPETEKFLRSIGMPVDQVVAINEEPSVPRTDFAAIDDFNAIPFIRDRGRAAYRDYLTRSSPKAFAVSSSGAWSWAEEGDDPVERVLAACQKSSQEPCRLYAVDDNVVWADNPGIPLNQNLATAPATAVTSTAGGSAAPAAPKGK